MILSHHAKYFEDIEANLLLSSNWQKFSFCRKWASTLPNAAGLYALLEEEKIVYVGETRNLSLRIKDMKQTYNHTIRRKIGDKRFCDVAGFIKATSKKKYPPHIEDLVNQNMENMRISVLPVPLGRKEAEEYIINKHKPIFNSVSKRGA